jgi:hypothetical protein
MILENEHVRVELEATTGGFRSIFDKKLAHEYIAAPERALMFRLMIPEDDEQWLHIDSLRPEIATSGQQAILTYALEGASARVTLSLDAWQICAELHVTNTGKHLIEEVIFPWVRGIGPIEGGRLVWPNFWKRSFDDVFGKDLGGDHHTWNEWSQKVVARYPAHLASAWCDYGNARHGLAIEGRHTDFSIMDFFVHKVVEKQPDGASEQDARRSLDLATVHPRRVKPGESYTSPSVLIAAHQGDWHTPADNHRAWLETWIRKPDRPAKFATSIGWHFFFMKHQDGYTPHTYEDLPRMAEAALSAGCPYLLLFGWQTGGHDNNYFYRYVPNEQWGGREALRRAVEKCRAMGVELIPFFNGTLANVTMPEHAEFGHRWEAKTRSGHAYYAGDWARHNFDAPSRNRAMLHTEVAFCEEQRAYFLESVKRIVQDYGFGNTQLDQISEKMLVDYDEAHVTTTPDRVFVDGLAELLPAVRRLVREVNPEGIMISEALNEFTGQWCDSSWDWNILIPFPEPILYTLPWLMASHEIDALEYGEVNKAFAYKMHLDMKIDGGDSPITQYPKFTEHVRSLAELRRRVADYYCFADFRDQEGIEVAAPENALVRTYRNDASGRASIVLAETDGKAATCSLKINWGLAEDKATVCSNVRGATSIPVAAPLSLELEPYEVMVVCLDTRPQQFRSHPSRFYSRQ